MSKREPQALPYGTWPSPLTADHVASHSRRLAEPQLDDEYVYWLESQPKEKGRIQIVRRSSSGETATLLPPGFSARSRVHEYGGGAYRVTAERIFFVNDSDQCIYWIDKSGGEPEAVTPPDPRRFADLALDSQHNRLLAVCEEPTANEVHNTLVAISLDGTQSVTTLVAGEDFYSYPRISPDGRRLCWLSWNHPDMPWDSTRLWVADLTASGVANRRCLAGESGEESVFQPQWSPNGDLFFVTDRDNWWNIYRLVAGALNSETKAQPVTQLEAEFATPLWTFNMSTYGFLDAQKLLATYTRDGRWHLITIDMGSGDTESGATQPVPSRLSHFSAIACHGGCAALLAASPDLSPEVHLMAAGELTQLSSAPRPLGTEDVSLPRSISFATTEGQTAHGFFYPPTNSGYGAPDGHLPPVIVMGHGGPTGATDTSLNLKIQYWTTRGFAVLDVNYRGSTGYGREYRHALYQHWGIRDVDDVCAAADYAAEKGWVHPHQRIIKGSSAGGYTVLAALAFRNTFDCGVSLYGVGDLELLAEDTHKFEARYLDKLVGPYPREQARYRALSPLHHVEGINCPLLVFQGLEDKVVPPNQAETIVEAVAAQHVPVAYITYAEEGHGFRQADTIRHMLAAEQNFYRRIFKLGDASADEPPVIRNLDAES